MIQIILIAIAAAALFGGGLTLGYKWEAGIVAERDLKIAKAEESLRIQAQKAEQDAANHITDMTAAYDAGEANAKTITRTIYIKGQAAVAKDVGLTNPVCVMSPDSLYVLNSARASLRTSSDPAGVPVPVPVANAGLPTGRPVLNPVSANDSGHGTVGGVPPPPRPAGSSGQVPGDSMSGHPKPKPIGK